MHRRTLLQGLSASAGLSLLPVASADTKPGRWLRMESANFIVFSTADEDKGREELIALERFHALLSRLMPRKDRSPLKLTVYVANSSQDFERTNPGIGKNVLGFYSSGMEQVYAVTSPDRAVERQRNMKKNIRALDARTVLFHEYAHHFLAANSRRTYPSWYNEGFSEFIGTADLTDDGIFVGKFTANRAIWLMNGDWLGIEKFLRGETKDSEDVAMFYAQSWLATHYMFMNHERALGFDRYCIALQEDGDPIATFEPAFGITPQAFDKELRDYKRKAIQFLKVPEEAIDHGASITTTRLGASADDLLMSLTYLQAVPPKQYAMETVNRVRKDAAKYPDDPFALNALALTDMWYGDPAQARSRLDGLLKLDPNNAETLHLSGLCDLRAGLKAKDAALVKRAQGSFAAAHRLDGTRAPSLFRYVECLLYLENKVSPHMVDVLVMAYRIAPQVDALALVAAQALIQLDRWEDAMVILRPLTVSVHGGKTAERAAVYLKAAQQKEKPPLTIYAAADTIDVEFE